MSTTISNFNQQDLTIRLQYTAIYLANFANSVVKGFNMGKKTTHADLEKLKLLIAYMEVVKDYIPLNDDILLGDIVTEADNFITEEQCKDIFEHISVLTKLVFASPGFNYLPAIIN